jgi:hypothetical protein
MATANIYVKDRGRYHIDANMEIYNAERSKPGGGDGGRPCE